MTPSLHERLEELERLLPRNDVNDEASIVHVNVGVLRLAISLIRAEMERVRVDATLPDGRECHHDEWLFIIGFDAFRICRGLPPKTFSAEQIVKWIGLMSQPKPPQEQPK